MRSQRDPEHRKNFLGNLQARVVFVALYQPDRLPGYPGSVGQLRDGEPEALDEVDGDAFPTPEQAWNSIMSNMETRVTAVMNEAKQKAAAWYSWASDNNLDKTSEEIAAVARPAVPGPTPPQRAKKTNGKLTARVHLPDGTTQSVELPDLPPPVSPTPTT